MAEINKNQEYFENNLDKESYNFLVELVKSGIYTWEDIQVKVKIEDKEIAWKGYLYMELTKVKKIKAKRIDGYVNANSLESLEEIEIEEDIGGPIYIEGINTDFTSKIIEKVRNGKLKVKGKIYLGYKYFNS